MTMPTTGDIALLLGTPLSNGRADVELHSVATLADAGEHDISFVHSDAYLKELHNTRAAAVIVRRGVKLPSDLHPAVLVVDDIDLALARLLERFAPRAQHLPHGIDPAARIDPTAQLAEAVSIGPFAVIGARARIGQRCVVHGGAHIGDDVIIGDDCTIWPNVVLRERITLGSRVIVHAGAVIGSDGFGYRWDGTCHAKIPQIGTVIIEDDVEVGSCACIDRAKMGVTRIGRGTKIDNLVQIAHNCTVGANCILAGQVGLAGSVMLEDGVVLGGQAAVADHLVVGAGAMVAGRSGIASNIEPNARVSGVPALPHRQTLREQAALRRLPELISQVKKLEEQIEALKRQLPGG